MKGALNIYRDNFLEKEELNRLMNFIRDNPALFLFVSNAQSFGIVQQGASLTIDPAFKIEVGTNSNTIKLVTDSYALDDNGNLIYQRAFDNLPILTDSLWYWVKISHRYDNYEQGFVNIAADGTLSGADTLFTDVLRGSSSGFPTKVKFYIQADDGSLVAANNSGVYEVVSVAGVNTAVIAGNLTAEGHLRYVVLGAFSIKTSVASIISTGIYSYDSCNIEFIAEEVTDTPPIVGFIANEEFYVARIMSDGTTVTVQDKRSDYYFRLNFGDIIVSNKANIDASNLTAPDIVLWIAALNMYTKVQIDNAISLLMVKTQNLNDVANKTSARSNLAVYSTTYIDNVIAALTSSVQSRLLINGNLADLTDKTDARTNLNVFSKEEQGLLLTKVIEIGDWNMDTVPFISVVHGIVDFTKIREVSVMIRNDANSVYYPLNFSDGEAVIINTLITMSRLIGGAFDLAGFSATAYNRGWITIKYIG